MERYLSDMGRGKNTIQITLFIVVCFSMPAQSRTLIVSKQGISGIGQALKMTAPGDTIRIMPGRYKERNLVIRNSIVILGIGWPVLDGENRYEIFTISADDVTISGLKMINTGIASINDISAISAIESRRLKILNNRFEKTFFGIHLANCSRSVIEGNVLHSNAQAEHQIGNGIHAWKCDSLIIKNNQVSGHRDGIYFEFVSNSRVEQNFSHHNMRYGLHFMFSHHDGYYDNTFRDNGAGVAVMYSKFVTMIDNHFEDNRGASSYGLLLKDIGDGFIVKNIFSRNTVGVFMEGTSRCSFDGNTFEENGWAAKIQANCDGNKFQKNNFHSNTFDISTNGSLVLNTMDYNYWDNYDGYDLDKNGIGDIPYHPVSLYSMVVEKMPASIMLWRSFLVYLLDKTEKVVPSITPNSLKDLHPAMRSYDRSL